MYKILIVEDEEDMLTGLQDNLEFDGYGVEVSREGGTGLHKITEEPYDLILLDIMLPDMSGFEVCRKVRKQGITTPIIFLTAKGEEVDKVRGLELGADDYITKPFSLRELLARVKALLRRTEHNGEMEKNGSCTIGKLTVNFRSYEATLENEPIKMTVKEIDILHLLIERKHQTVHRDEILSGIWGIDNSITTRTVDNFIHKLREKIEKDPGNPQHIITVHGVGYKLV